MTGYVGYLLVTFCTVQHAQCRRLIGYVSCAEEVWLDCAVQCRRLTGYVLCAAQCIRLTGYVGCAAQCIRLTDCLGWTSQW